MEYQKIFVFLYLLKQENNYYENTLNRYKNNKKKLDMTIEDLKEENNFNEMYYENIINELKLENANLIDRKRR